jgi:uncharacterized protein
LIATTMHSKEVRTADDRDLSPWVFIFPWVYIASSETVDTVAASAVAASVVLFAYRWPKTNVDRYRRVQRFVEAFFPRIGAFQRRPRHPKWRDVNRAAALPGWTRFEAAQAWRDRHLRAAPAGTPAAQPATSGPAAGRPF